MLGPDEEVVGSFTLILIVASFESDAQLQRNNHDWKVTLDKPNEIPALP